MSNSITKNTIEHNLGRIGYDTYSISLIPDINNENKYLNNIYKLSSSQKAAKILKIRNSDQMNIKNALTYVNAIKDKENLIEKYADIHLIDNLYYLFTDFINGYNPIKNKDIIMPKVFNKLANMHKNNSSHGKYYSKYSDGRISDTIENMVDSEIDYHFTFIEENDFKRELIKLLNPLKTCLPCIIHEDVHPGNVLVSSHNENDIKLIDCEWVHPGLNIYDFEYIDLFGQDHEWWSINNNGLECYKSYYNNMDIDHQIANQQIRAFETLKLIRKNTYYKYFKMIEKYKSIKKVYNSIREYKNFI